MVGEKRRRVSRNERGEKRDSRRKESADPSVMRKENPGR